jgi:hypothetical protein
VFEKSRRGRDFKLRPCLRGYLAVATTTGYQTGTDAGLGVDTGLSRISAGVLGVGTGAQGSVAGTLQLTRLDGASANADMQGNITSASGTTVSKTFATNYTSTPIVTVTPTTNAGAFYLSSVSNSGFTMALRRLTITSSETRANSSFAFSWQPTEPSA